MLKFAGWFLYCTYAHWHLARLLIRHQHPAQVEAVLEFLDGVGVRGSDANKVQCF